MTIPRGMQARVRLPNGLEREAGRCRSCGAAVVFVLNPRTGRRPPYDPSGDSHFATCPDAQRWRGRSAKRSAP